jgi:hypothetical protein
LFSDEVVFHGIRDSWMTIAGVALRSRRQEIRSTTPETTGPKSCPATEKPRFPPTRVQSAGRGFFVWLSVGFVLKGESHPRAERRDLSIIHFHIHLGDFRNAQVTQ